jgi:hypothetical protein
MIPILIQENVIQQVSDIEYDTNIQYNYFSSLIFINSFNI